MGEKVQPPWRAGQDVRGLAKQVGPEGQLGVGTLQLEGGGHTAEPAEYMDPGFRWAYSPQPRPPPDCISLLLSLFHPIF